MIRRSKITADDTAELQRLYSELPWAIAEAARSDISAPQAPDQPFEGDEKVDTIIRRICQLPEEPE
jgi:hypothetical protein